MIHFFSDRKPEISLKNYDPAKYRVINGKKLSLKKSALEDETTLPEIIADKICGGHNQHVIMFFEGKTGTGKSYASLRLAYECSLLFADNLGGRPEYYFNIDQFQHRSCWDSHR
jgi:hypothetical protein